MHFEPHAHRLGAPIVAVLLLLCSTVFGSKDPGTLTRLAMLLDVPAEQTSCQELPPTPNPLGPSAPLTQCVGTSDGIQFVTIRADGKRLVWLDYTGPWLRGAAGAERWSAMLEALERELGEAKGPRTHCRLWALEDGVVRAALLGSSDADDGTITLQRVSVSGSDTNQALGC